MNKQIVGLSSLLTILACSQGKQPPAETSPSAAVRGGLALTLGTIPDNVRCVRVGVDPENDVLITEERDVAPGDEEALFSIDDIRVGAATIRVEAFDVVCSDIAGEHPTWISYDAAVAIQAGVVQAVNIALYQVGGVDIGVFWEDVSGHLIDDMEHLHPGEIYTVEGRSGDWFAANDGTCSQYPAPGDDVGFTTDAYEGQHAVTTSGGPCTDWGATIGFMVNDPDGTPMPYDASRYAGVRFMARVTAGSNAFQLACSDGLSHPKGGVCDEAAGTCWDAPSITLPATGSWEAYAVQWAELKPGGWSGNDLTLDARTLFGCQLNIAAGDVFEIVVDDVQLMESPEPIPLSQLPSFSGSFAKGFNFGNRLDAPNEGDWGPPLSAINFRDVAAQEFDHVRLPVRFSVHALETAPYTLDPGFMERVDWAIAQALLNGLSIIVDFHHYEEIMNDPAGQEARFLEIWEQLATRYQGLPDAVAFELLNEPIGPPAGNLDASKWNALLPQAINVVRQTNPTRLIIVDGPSWASAYEINTLNLPAGDPNLLASVHTYEPTLFTGQGGEWNDPAWWTKGVIYPGPPATPIEPVAEAMAIQWMADWFHAYNTEPAATNPSGPATISAMFTPVSSFIGINGYGVYNGEFGVSNAADAQSRANWMRDIREASENSGVGWAVWDNNGGGMHILNTETGEWDADALNALFN